MLQYTSVTVNCAVWLSEPTTIDLSRLVASLHETKPVGYDRIQAKLKASPQFGQFHTDRR